MDAIVKARSEDVQVGHYGTRHGSDGCGSDKVGEDYGSTVLEANIAW